ncbi:MAG: hypothetical protein IIB54_09920 [Planctomycetes bacterium]|nr:hypothetical protein [Planctomycetota bacterium]
MQTDSGKVKPLETIIVSRVVTHQYRFVLMHPAEQADMQMKGELIAVGHAAYKCFHANKGLKPIGDIVLLLNQKNCTLSGFVSATTLFNNGGGYLLYRHRHANGVGNLIERRQLVKGVFEPVKFSLRNLWHFEMIFFLLFGGEYRAPVGNNQAI